MKILQPSCEPYFSTLSKLRLSQYTQVKKNFTTSVSNIIKCQKERVQLYWSGCQSLTTHRCYPTTAQHGDFCLLRHRPGPVHPSLDDLGTLGSPGVTISMPGLVRTPDLHSPVTSRSPDLKPSTFPGLQVAGLQE